MFKIKLSPMKNRLLLFFSFVLFVAACGKKTKKQFSTWTITGENFSSNNVNVTIGKVRVDLACSDQNRFGLTFNIGNQLPKAGNFGIEHNSGSKSDSVSVGFYKGSVFYVISPFALGMISASEVNKKASYLLAPTWFVNYHDSQDSVLISGKFNEP